MDAKLVLKYPITIDGKEIKEIKYDFENLTAKDMAEAEMRMTGSGQVASTFEEFNYSYHSYLFAAAAVKANPETDISDYMRLRSRDVFKSRGLARNFLLGVEDGEQENLEKQP